MRTGWSLFIEGDRTSHLVSLPKKAAVVYHIARTYNCLTAAQPQFLTQVVFASSTHRNLERGPLSGRKIIFTCGSVFTRFFFATVVLGWLGEQKHVLGCWVTIAKRKELWRRQMAVDRSNVAIASCSLEPAEQAATRCLILGMFHSGINRGFHPTTAIF